jgi:hypothetical protein
MMSVLHLAQPIEEAMHAEFLLDSFLEEMREPRRRVH